MATHGHFRPISVSFFDGFEDMGMFGQRPFSSSGDVTVQAPA